MQGENCETLTENFLNEVMMDLLFTLELALQPNNFH